MNDQLYTTLNNDNQMPLFGLGAYDMHGVEAEAAVSTALEIGYRLIDTAAMYGNEKEVGSAVRKSTLPRSELFITTKVNNNSHGYDNTMRAFDESMRRLNVDYIDLYLIHWPIKNKRADTWRALEKLYAEKQVKAIGVANYLLPFLHELEQYATVTPAVNQVEFSPFLFLKDVYEYCKVKHIQLQAYSPLTRGKKFNDPTLVRIAQKHGKTPAQILLRWNLELGVSAIPKSVSRTRLEENVDVFDFALEKSDLQALNSLNENFRIVNDPSYLL